MTIPEKLAALRKLMSAHKIDAWIVPSDDPHQSEYVADRWKARAWLSGFTGSAGTVVVTADKAGLWTDSRYFLQAEMELKDSGITLFKEDIPGVPYYKDWFREVLKENAVVGFDGKVMSVSQVKDLESKLAAKKISFAYHVDLIDNLWQDRPSIPGNPAFILEEKYAGESRTSKINHIRAEMKKHKADYLILSALDDIAWTLNIRGSDVEYNPVTYCYAVIAQTESRLFITEKKLNKNVNRELTDDRIIIDDYDKFFDFLTSLPESTVLLDPDKTSQKIMDSISLSCVVLETPSIPFDLKACKNETELKGIRNAHIRDGVALVKWLYWLNNHIGKEEHTEISIADKLKEFRSKGEFFQGLSFDTIAGYKGNGAIVHYSAKPETAAKIYPEGILLIDSGGQYLDGTTDITRTITLGKPTEEEKTCFTLVLKGHINLGKLVFPKGYNGSQIDVVARAAMWEFYMNYGHGTGHGVGHFLNVHEGPQRIRPENNVPLKPGMLTSNEPGLYIKGKFGIRIENLIVTTVKKENEFGTFFGFETVSFCPICLDLVNVNMLTGDEKKWLNDYHKAVYEKLGPFLSADEKNWLQHETRAV